jgi:hypothetical protein
VLSKLLPAALVIVLLPTVAAGQDGLGNLGGSGNLQGSGMSDGNLGPRALTPAETFMAKLKLDEKTQVPEAEQILTAAAREAAPLATQLLQFRQGLLNAEVGKDAEMVKKGIEAYTATAAKLATIEAQAFAKIYAMLKPNQQSKAAEAFELLPVIIAPGTPVAGGGGRGMGRRGGGQ